MTTPLARTVAGIRVDTTTADRIGNVFYAVVALIALAGQTLAAVHWLHWWWPFALAAVAALELGGIALTAHADVRRRLGERAYAARIVSAAVAGFAVVVNWIGHPDKLQAAFFAGMSALGYGVWLINAGARRRDQLRAAGNLPPVAPAYGLWQWARHPMLTRRARVLALATPTLGLYGSLAAATAQARAEQRQTAIAEALRLKLTAAVDPLTARIAVATFDLDEIAARLAANADYDGLTALIGADLTPARLTAVEPAPAAEPAQPEPVALVFDEPAEPPAADEAEPATPVPAKRRPTTGPKRQPSAAERVAKAVARTPNATAAQIAARLKLSERTVQRHMRTAVDSVSTAPVDLPNAA